MGELRTDILVTTDVGEKIHLWLGERRWYGLTTWELWAYYRMAKYTKARG